MVVLFSSPAPRVRASCSVLMWVLRSQTFGSWTGNLLPFQGSLCVIALVLAFFLFKFFFVI